MRFLLNNIQKVMMTQFQIIAKLSLQLVMASMFLTVVACSNSIQPDIALNVDPVLQQAVFETPEQAADIFVEAVKTNNEEQLNKLLGADFRSELKLGDVSGEDANNFINAWNKNNILLVQGENKVLLAVGKEQWILPIPIVKSASGWYFDVEEGHERMRIRRIGRNELGTMQAVLAYYDAQIEYAEQDRNGNGILEYAQKLISIPGTQDGLFWQTKAEEPLSPLGPLLADRTEDGGYHGYFYRIMTAQGENATGGAYNYLIGNNLRAGFAMIAWPMEYGETGVMSFIVSHDGIVYEKNLGGDGAVAAENMKTFDPDESWVPTKEVMLK